MKVIGALLTVTILVVVGIVVGVIVAKNNKSSSKTSSSSSVGVVNQSDPNDPSTFELDSRLKKSFWGIAYTPENSQYPDCGNKLGEHASASGRRRGLLTTRIPYLEDVITDIQVMLSTHHMPDDLH